MKRAIKNVTHSPKTLHTGIVMTLVASLITAAAANFSTLRNEIPAIWYFVGMLVIAGSTTLLHFYQAHRRKVATDAFLRKVDVAMRQKGRGRPLRSVPAGKRPTKKRTAKKRAK